MLLLIAIILLINVISTRVFERLDLTKDKRFTLAESTKTLLREIDDVVTVRVYLEGDFPAGFKRLRNSAKELLDEFRSHSKGKIEYIFIDPSDGDSQKDIESFYTQLIKKGLRITRLTITKDDEISQKLIFPGAVVTYRGKEISVNFLQNQVGMGEQEILNNSISKLEYSFAHAIHNLKKPYEQKIGLIAGHGGLEEVEISDLTNLMSNYYTFEWIDLQQNVFIPKIYTAIIIAKPKSPFSELDKFKIDQYVMNGGKVLWVLDAMEASMDSLQGEPLYLSNKLDLNLDDILFKYGVRLNKNLVQDIQCARIPIVVEYLDNTPQFEPYDWLYFPIILSSSDHPISKNLDGILSKFISTIDTVGAKGIKKTTLLHTSKYSRVLYSPVRINFSIIEHKPSIEMFNKPNLTVAVLLEGKFESAFKYRTTPEFEQHLKDSLNREFVEESVETKMIVISDGDIIRNEVGKDGRPYPLGYYPYTQQTFANQEFIINCIEYLCDESGIIQTGAKEIKLRMLDNVKIKDEKLTWQLINMLVPIGILLVFGFIYNFVRHRRYAM